MLQKWADAWLWLMTFNPSKCEFVHVAKSQKNIPGFVTIQHLIKAVTHVKSLGVAIDEHLSFNKHSM